MEQGKGGNRESGKAKTRRGRFKNAEMLKIQKAEMKTPN
jgi:hypothetical protein